MSDPTKAVAEWIEGSFEPGAIKVTDFPAFPYGKLITDRNGDTMVVFWDILRDKVDYRFPDGDPQEP